MKLATRIAKLEGMLGADDRAIGIGPIIYRPNETEAAALSRLGLTEQDIGGLGLTIWLPEIDNGGDE